MYKKPRDIKDYSLASRVSPRNPRVKYKKGKQQEFLFVLEL